MANKSGRIFCVRQVYFAKSCQQIWACVNQPFIYTCYTSHLRWNSTMRRCIYHTDLGQNAVFHCFSKQLYSVNIQDDQSLAFSETVQKISKITYTASRFSLLTSAKFSVNIKRVTLHHNKEFTVFIFLLFNGFITMCNLKKRLIRATFWVLLQAMFIKTNGTARETLTINKRDIIRWNIYRDNNFFIHEDKC